MAFTFSVLCWGSHSTHVERSQLGTCLSSCLSDEETEGQKQVRDLSSAMWLLSSWWQSDKWDHLPPGPELVPVFTLPLSAECHLILIYFPNYTAWRIKGNFQGCLVVFKLGNVIMHVLWRHFCNNRHIYSIASSVVWKSDQILPHEVSYIMTSRKTINANFKPVQRIFKSSCLQKVNLETFSLYIWMFVLLKSRRGVWYNVAYCWKQQTFHWWAKGPSRKQLRLHNRYFIIFYEFSSLCLTWDFSFASLSLLEVASSVNSLPLSPKSTQCWEDGIRWSGIRVHMAGA